MPISDFFEKLGRAVFESPFGALDSADSLPELAEVRLAILDEVKSRSHLVGRSRVFPHNLVRVRLCGVPAESAGVFQTGFFAGWCRDELRQGLTRSGYRFPSDLEVEVETAPQLPGPGGQWVIVEAVSRAGSAEPAELQPARITVVKGAAAPMTLVITKARTNIGRTADVYRTDGPSRKNDLAFDETGEINRSVSREHAHILLDRKTGACRLFADRLSGVWIVRDGMSSQVHRDARGMLLESGDEIHLGRAVLSFER